MVHVAMFQQMYTVGFDENGVPLLPSVPLVYFSPKGANLFNYYMTNTCVGENCVEAVAGEMQGFATSKSLQCRIVGLVSAFNDCAIVCGVTPTNYMAMKEVVDKVAGSMVFKMRGTILYSN